MTVPANTAAPLGSLPASGSVGAASGEKAGSSQDGAGKTDLVCIADSAKCEVYVCFEGPLGAHLKPEVRENICNGEYMEIFSLLSLEKI